MGCDIYLSAEAMDFQTQSRKDDLISMVYTLVYLVNDQTEWAYEFISNIDEQRDLIYNAKVLSSAQQIC